jgi:hypothetical protein
MLEGVHGEETGRNLVKARFSSQGGGWEDLVGWIETQGEEDTQGFVIRYK